MECLHAEMIYDCGATYCVFCGEICKIPLIPSEDPAFASRKITNTYSKEKYFVRALASILGEEEVSDYEREVLERVALDAVEKLGKVPLKLYLKRFVSKRVPSEAVICRKHFPLLMSYTGHPLPTVTDMQKRYLFAMYERASLAFVEKRGAVQKKNLSCKDIIQSGLREFRESRPPQSVPLGR